MATQEQLPNGPEDLVGKYVQIQDVPGKIFLAEAVDNRGRVVLGDAGEESLVTSFGGHKYSWRTHWLLCKVLTEGAAAGLPADWLCPHCKTRFASVDDHGNVTCVKGHESR